MKVIEMDALIVKGADHAEIVNSYFFQATNVEDPFSRIKMVVAAWCLANPNTIEFTAEATVAQIEVARLIGMSTK